MFPLFRLIKMAVHQRSRPRLRFDEMSEVSFYCRPWDLDLQLEVNNGRVLTLYDIGRMDLAFRCGLIKALRRNRWGLAVAGGSNRFRKRVHFPSKITIKTQAVGYDERWIYMSQSMWVKGEAASNGLFRTCVTERGRAVSTDRVIEALGAEDWQPELPDWVKAWIAADEMRPWPPNSD